MKTLLALLLLLPITLFSQERETPRYLKTTIYNVVSVSPEFKGGPKAMAEFIVNNFKYPETAREYEEEGTVWIEFVVRKNGKLSDIKVVKGVSRSLNNECIRVISLMPRWKPGRQNGKRVNVRYTIPIKARL